MGEVGKGYKYAIETLNTGRIGIAAQVSECPAVEPPNKAIGLFVETLTSSQRLKMNYILLWETWFKACP